MPKPDTLIVDHAVDETATRICLYTLRIRRYPSTPSYIDVLEHLELFQEYAIGDDPKLSTDDQAAFNEAFGIEFKRTSCILVPPGFDESIRLPASIPNRFQAMSDGSVIDMDRLHAA